MAVPPGQQDDLALDSPNQGSPAATGALQPWPSTLPEQVRALAQLLAAAPAAQALPAIEARFKGKGPWEKGLPRILETLETLGRARREGDGWRGQPHEPALNGYARVTMKYFSAAWWLLVLALSFGLGWGSFWLIALGVAGALALLLAGVLRA